MKSRNIAINQELVGRQHELALFENSKNKTIERVLITVEGVNEAVINKGYFDHILMIEDLFII